ncbi:MAG TPA: gfo/Idh/MocA family oxidoreductase, partial [Candidatus Hydrogenedentes bacterium]|nr:gfo/Idh/MocA family oxidoreductase [Candidatus Hydrogenedentota bacterium]
EFPATAMTAGDTVRGTWYDGGKRPGPEAMGLPAGTPLPDAGSVIVGEEGVMVLPHCDKATVLYPAEKFKEFKQPELPGLNHYHQWVNACLGTDTAASNFSYAGPLAEAVLLGNVANRCAGQTLEWDAPNLRITNMPEANALLRVPYREGWEVEGLS